MTTGRINQVSTKADDGTPANVSTHTHPHASREQGVQNYAHNTVKWRRLSGDATNIAMNECRP